MRGYSSVVEHLTADREVHGSTPCAPYDPFWNLINSVGLLYFRKHRIYEINLFSLKTFVSK